MNAGRGLIVYVWGRNGPSFYAWALPKGQGAPAGVRVFWSGDGRLTGTDTARSRFAALVTQGWRLHWIELVADGSVAAAPQLGPTRALTVRPLLGFAGTADSVRVLRARPRAAPRANIRLLLGVRPLWQWDAADAHTVQLTDVPLNAWPESLRGAAERLRGRRAAVWLPAAVSDAAAVSGVIDFAAELGSSVELFAAHSAPAGRRSGDPQPWLWKELLSDVRLARIVVVRAIDPN